MTVVMPAIEASGQPIKTDSTMGADREIQDLIESSEEGDARPSDDE